jgi:putative sugar O-methyltransferase
VKNNYIKRRYYRIDSILESLKVLLIWPFLKKPKLFSHKPFLFKTPPNSVIRFNFLGRVIISFFYIILYFFNIKKIPFEIEKIGNKESYYKSKFINQESLTNPVPVMLKNHVYSPEIEDNFKENIKNSYINSIKDNHLNFKDSIWWNECILEIKAKLFDNDNNLIIKNFENIFNINFKAILFEMSSPIKENKSKFINFISALKIINQYHSLSDIIDDSVLRSISESRVGGNRSIVYNGQRLSERLIRYGYYTSQIIKNTNFLNNEKLVFLDLGGGFGGLSRVLLNYNNKSKCIIIEQPEICAVASYYMKLNFPNKRIINYSDFKDNTNKDDLFKNKEFDIMILPHWCIEFIPDDFINLTINTTSLGEMSKQHAEYFFKNIERITKEYFYSNNKLTSTENIWDGFGHYQFSFKKNWMTLIYNYSYTWHQELLAKKND